MRLRRVVSAAQGILLSRAGAVLYVLWLANIMGSARTHKLSWAQSREVLIAAHHSALTAAIGLLQGVEEQAPKAPTEHLDGQDDVRATGG